MNRLNLRKIFTSTYCKFTKRGLKNKIKAIFITVLVVILLIIIFFLLFLNNSASYINKNIRIMRKIEDKVSPLKEENSILQDIKEKNDTITQDFQETKKTNELAITENDIFIETVSPPSNPSISIEEESVQEASNGNKVEVEVLDYINRLRNELGVQKLSWDNDIYTFAQIRANEISTLYSHVRPNGLTSASSNILIRGENLAYGQISSIEIFEDWKNSPSHYNNLVDSSFSKGAIAYSIKDEVYYWVFLVS